MKLLLVEAIFFLKSIIIILKSGADFTCMYFEGALIIIKKNQEKHFLKEKLIKGFVKFTSMHQLYYTELSNFVNS